MKKISVLIPAFNAVRTIVLAAESMLWQEIPAGYEYEVIIIDDASTDGTSEALRPLCAQHRRLKVLSNEKNLGVARSLRRLVGESEAEYLVRMDADDVSLPGRIVAQVEALEAGHDLVGTFAYNFGSMHGERTYSVERLHHVILALIDQRSFCHPTIAFNKKVAKIGYKENAAEDYELLTDVLVAGLSVTNVPRHLLMYRVHGESLSSSADSVRFARLRRSVCAIRANYISRLLGVEGADAVEYSNCIERRIFRREAPEDAGSLDRLGAIVRECLGVSVDFRRI